MLEACGHQYQGIQVNLQLCNNQRKNYNPTKVNDCPLRTTFHGSIVGVMRPLMSLPQTLVRPMVIGYHLTSHHPISDLFCKPYVIQTICKGMFAQTSLTNGLVIGHQ